MKIKEITINKSRTIMVDGIMGRDKYRKISIGLVAELNIKEEFENPQMAYDLLSEEVDKSLQSEIEKLNQTIKNKKNE